MMSLKAYNTWLNKAKKGDRVTYYRGYLVEPLLQPISPTVDRDRVTRLGKEVLKTYDANLVSLVQKRHANFDYEYMAVRK